MAAPRSADYPWVMATATAIQTSSPRPLTIIAALVLAVFGAFSTWVAATQGYFGFLRSAGSDRWALQMLLDLAISLAFAVGWMRADARKRGLAVWPFVVATVLFGSLGILAYCVRRGVVSATA
jgi:hypothetical protein